MTLPSHRFRRVIRAPALAPPAASCAHAHRQKPGGIARALLVAWALEGLAMAAPSQPGPSQVVARSLPAQSGVLSEAETLIDAPPEQVAALLSDPKNYLPIFPANSVQVVDQLPMGKVIAVEMKKPWPVGTVRWVEDVVTRTEPDGQTFVVERTAHPGYFRRMTARWRVSQAPGAQGKSLVTYQVAMELSRWAPEVFLKRGNIAGIVDTMNRLRKLVAERGLTPASSAPAPATAPAAIDSPKHKERAPSETP